MISDRNKYRWLHALTAGSTVTLGSVLMALAILGSRAALGLPMGSAPLDGVRPQFIAWIVLCIASIPAAFIAASAVVTRIVGWLLVHVGRCTSERARFLVTFAPGASWKETNSSWTALRFTGNNPATMQAQGTVLDGLLAGDKTAIDAFGDNDNCVVVDWREGAVEIFDALADFLPPGYLQAERHGRSGWCVSAGGRPARTLKYSSKTKKEEFFVLLNEALAPDFELRHYAPHNGDSYVLFLAPRAWWLSFTQMHPKAAQKYFLSAERVATYWNKGYLARLFSKP